MTNTTRRIYSVALMAALSLGLSGCWFNNNNDDQTTVTDTSSASASPSASTSPSPSASSDPTALPTIPADELKEINKNLEEKPLGIDIKMALENRSAPEVKEVFPAENFNMEQGVRQVLNTYEAISGISEWQSAREPGSPPDSHYLIGFEDSIHGDLIENLKQKVDANGVIVPVTTRDGVLGEIDGVTYHGSGELLSNYGEPAFGVIADDTYGNLLVINGLRSDRVSTLEGKALALEYEYTIYAAPSAEKWLIMGLAIKNTDAKVVD